MPVGCAYDGGLLVVDHDFFVLGLEPVCDGVGPEVFLDGALCDGVEGGGERFHLGAFSENSPPVLLGGLRWLSSDGCVDLSEPLIEALGVVGCDDFSGGAVLRGPSGDGLGVLGKLVVEVLDEAQASVDVVVYDD